MNPSNNATYHLEDEIRFKNIQAINLAYLSNQENFELTEAQEQLLYDEAYTTKPNANYARALLALLKEEIIIPTDPELEEQADAMMAYNSGMIENQIATAPQAQLIIAPNPAQNTIEVTFPSEIEAGILQIYNINGQLIKQQKIAPNTRTLNLSVLDIQKGMYFIGLNQNGELKYVKKLVIAR